VGFGLKARSLDGVKTVGVDEVKYKCGHKHLTLAYQIDKGEKACYTLKNIEIRKVSIGFFY
jgi:hypothetical protein